MSEQLAEPVKPPVDWDAVRDAYLAGKLSKSEICETFGCSDSSLSKRILRGRWAVEKAAAVAKLAAPAAPSVVGAFRNSSDRSRNLAASELQRTLLVLSQIPQTPNLRTVKARAECLRTLSQVGSEVHCWRDGLPSERLDLAMLRVVQRASVVDIEASQPAELPPAEPAPKNPDESPVPKTA